MPREHRNKPSLSSCEAGTSPAVRTAAVHPPPFPLPPRPTNAADCGPEKNVAVGQRVVWRGGVSSCLTSTGRLVWRERREPQSPWSPRGPLVVPRPTSAPPSHFPYCLPVLPPRACPSCRPESNARSAAERCRWTLLAAPFDPLQAPSRVNGGPGNV